jgi:hypothetical protein
MSDIKGKWQFKFLFSHLKELLKLYINLLYRFFISCLILEIFSIEVMRCPIRHRGYIFDLINGSFVTSQQGLII